MKMFKCEKCNLITSEEFKVCPKCKSTEERVSIDMTEEKTSICMDCEGDTIYKLIMEDFDGVVEDYCSDDEKETLKSIPRYRVVQILKNELSFDWVEGIESIIDYLLDLAGKEN